MDINQTCCFTGHRHLPQIKIWQIQKLLENEIVNLINHGVTRFLNGGALGFDMLSAETVLRLKHQYPQTRLVMVLPCRKQDGRWNFTDKQRYHNILSQADETICLSENYYDGCMLARNRYMVDNSNHCIAYLTQSRSGTLYTVNYALSKNVEVINLSKHLR